MTKTKKQKNKKVEIYQNEQTDEAIYLFNKAKKDIALSRHARIDGLLDSAVEVLETSLEDPNTLPEGKMFQAKLAVDIYSLKEKFVREDQKLLIDREKLLIDKERLLIEKEKLSLEKNKINNLALNSSTTLIGQQNNYQVSSETQTSEAKIKLLQRKKEQARLLEEASGISQEVDLDKIK